MDWATKAARRLLRLPDGSWDDARVPDIAAALRAAEARGMNRARKIAMRSYVGNPHHAVQDAVCTQIAKGIHAETGSMEATSLGTGPESTREEVAPSDRSPQRDCSPERLDAEPVGVALRREAQETNVRMAIERLLGMLETPWRPIPGCLLCDVDGFCTQQCASSRVSFARAVSAKQIRALLRPKEVEGR